MHHHPYAVKTSHLCLRASLCAVLFVLSQATVSAQSSITVQADGPTRDGSPSLYGIFIEDWCHQVEGGIYAEMVRNRNFDDTKSAKEVLVAGFAMQLPDADKGQDNKEIPAWKLITGKDGAASMSIDQSKPLNERNPRCLRLEVKDVSGKTGVYNEGHCNNVQGIAVKQGGEYKFSVFARSESPNAGINVSIESPEGKVLASDKITPLSADWKQYELTLKSSESLTGARLFLAPTVPGTYYMDMVSLFPKDTWKNRANGLRADLMELVAGLKPAFVRFPGGCFVEGLEPENSWLWKNTIGPVEKRPGHWNIWGWRYSEGIGYHEYLQMCEDLGAEPVHVINDGISHTAKNGVQQDGVYTYVPMDKMGELVQDALDSIEYANGPVDSKWGSLRAAAGHPEPFHLKYIEVGNENFGPEYAERYALFQDAIKAKYPEITVIMDTWGPTNYPRNRVPDMLDIHRFTTPFQFALNYNQFDNYDRKGPKVYFGEWCVELELPGKESLETGLYEGVFLTGLEKNSDLVRMMSYAPFMNNIGWQDRKPNMICFDLDRAYGAPIYWIQRMYAHNTVQKLLPFIAESPEYRPAKVGTVGFGTLKTAAEFKDIVVKDEAGKTLFDGNSAKPSDWSVIGKKKEKDSGLSGGTISFSEEDGLKVLTKKEFSGNYTLTCKARRLSGNNGFLVYFNTYFNSATLWQVGGDGNKSSKIVGDGFIKTDIPKLTLEDGRWYDLKLEVRGDEISGYVDGQLINRTSYRPLQSLYVSAGRNEAAGEIVLKVVNISSKAQKTDIKISGATLDPNGEAIVLTANDPHARNSRENPENVVPKTVPINGVSSDFKHEFPAYSATVLKLKKKD